MKDQCERHGAGIYERWLAHSRAREPVLRHGGIAQRVLFDLGHVVHYLGAGVAALPVFVDVDLLNAFAGADALQILNKVLCMFAGLLQDLRQRTGCIRSHRRYSFINVGRRPASPR